MDELEIASELRKRIISGDLLSVKNLIGKGDASFELETIENFFKDSDPINFAIDEKQEDIAIYLTELGFSTTKSYELPGRQCDQWCYHDHGPGPCPEEYDAEKNAEEKGFRKLTELLRSMKSGQRLPNDPQQQQQSPEKVPRPPPPKTKPSFTRPHPPVNKTQKTDADRAREMLIDKGTNYAHKDGGTLLHWSVQKPAIYAYVFANGGVPVNIQNNDGDTALHVAIRKDKYELAECLLQCGADLCSRNSLGQSVADETEDNKYADLIKRFQPGPVHATLNGNCTALDRLIKRMWVGMNNIVKDGKTLMELAESKLNENPCIINCIRVLKEYKTTSDLIHAVLSEDEFTVKTILNTRSGWCLNSRFKDKYGKTLLSHAIDSNSVEIVRMLLEHGANVNRVRVHDRKNYSTIPLFHTCLNKETHPDIAKMLYKIQDSQEIKEKDADGNTALLRAIQHGADCNFVYWLMKTAGGNSVCGRNKEGLSPVELAEKLGRWDVVKAIHRYIVRQCGKFFMVSLPVNFYGEDNINKITDERTGNPLTSIVTEKDDVKSICKYREIENQGVMLLTAAVNDRSDVVSKLNEAAFQDKNGYTALTRAIVFQKYHIASLLCTSRPALKLTPDNCNRYPLHYSYALPESCGSKFVKLLLEKDPVVLENRVDKDGRFPAEYRDIRDTVEIRQMLYDARTLDCHRQRTDTPGVWPDDAEMMAPI